MSHGGVAESARQVSIKTAAKLPAIPRRGSGGYPSEGHMRIELDRIWTECWRGRSREIEGDRRRSKEVGRILPNFADLRSISPASGVLDPIWSILKPLN